MRTLFITALFTLAAACTPSTRCPDPPLPMTEARSDMPVSGGVSSVTVSSAAPTASKNLAPSATLATASVASEEAPLMEAEWPKFICNASLNRTLTTATGFEPNIVLSRNQKQIEIEGVVDPGLAATTQIVESYRLNGTRYFVATTRPGVTKIHYSFFLYVNQEDRGLLELRSLSGSLRIGYYDLVCKH